MFSSTPEIHGKQEDDKALAKEARNKAQTQTVRVLSARRIDHNKTVLRGGFGDSKQPATTAGWHACAVLTLWRRSYARVTTKNRSIASWCRLVIATMMRTVIKQQVRARSNVNSNECVSQKTRHHTAALRQTLTDFQISFTAVVAHVALTPNS